jgi:hypothetical protein
MSVTVDRQLEGSFLPRASNLNPQARIKRINKSSTGIIIFSVNYNITRVNFRL